MITPPLKIALVDDHRLFRKGLISLIDVVNKNVEVVFEADNGADLQQKITKENQPDIILMDINMPSMNGFESVTWLAQHYPLVKVLDISMIDSEASIVKMLKLGVKGYLGKDVEPKELGEALHSISNKGYYYTDFITGKLIHSLHSPGNGDEEAEALKGLNDREREFLKFTCTEMTYNEIAGQMFLSPKTIDGYRAALFEKLSVKSRVGLVLFAIKNGLVML